MLPDIIIIGKCLNQAKFFRTDLTYKAKHLGWNCQLNQHLRPNYKVQQLNTIWHNLQDTYMYTTQKQISWD